MLRVNVSPRFDEHNKVIGVVQVIQDNTEECDSPMKFPGW